MSLLDRLNSLTPKNSPEVVERECAQSLYKLYLYLPLLGFILRSTNVRNAFEIFHPLLRLAQQLLEPESQGITTNQNGTHTNENSIKKTRLIISSEWEYSPLAYSDIPDLPGFVLIGFPATESGNVLLAPLAGHELGHSLWSLRRCSKSVSKAIHNALIEIIIVHSREFEELFDKPNVTEDELTSDMFNVDIWQPALNWALCQAEETFCDLVGLKVFGTAYLHSFSYLLSPGICLPRSTSYPSLSTRVKNLVRVANIYCVKVPDDFESSFENKFDTDVSFGRVDKFRLDMADKTLEKVLVLLSKLAASIVDSSIDPADSRDKLDTEPDVDSQYKTISKNGTEKILERFHMAVPAIGCESFTEILNAAWMAFTDDKLWVNVPALYKDRYTILNELVLKTTEIFEIEQRQKEHQEGIVHTDA